LNSGVEHESQKTFKILISSANRTTSQLAD